MTDTSARPAAATAIYRGMDRAALDAAYNNSVAVADSADWLARWRELSTAVRASPRARLDIPYGSRPRARFDYFPAGAARAPLFVFIHGGYWQRNDKDIFAFLAEGPRAHGIDVAVVGYTLAPDVRLTDIVGEIRQALSVLRERADEFGFDHDRLFVGGWSAGGHLTAIVSGHPAFRGGLPISGIFDLEPIALNYLKGHPAFRGGLPISGIFDLEPIALNYLNEKLALDASEIATLSPLRVLGDHSPPLRLFVGGDELPELRRQSASYAQAARERGLPVTLTVLPARHHYSILDELARPDGAITRALVALIEESARKRG
jgi:arylformamidase